MRASKQPLHRLFLLIVLTMMMPIMLWGQNNTNSPYTRFGYGQLADQGFSRSLSMGGIVYGLRNSGNINTANPASYSAVDSTSLVFEMGASALISNFKSGNDKRTTFNGNLDYLALQFPITRWMGMSVGLIPFSFVGYNYSFKDSVATPSLGNPTYTTYEQIFSGSGGISQVYLGASFNIAHHVSLGANVYYMFGNIDHTRYLGFSEGQTATSQVSKLYVRSFNGRFGAQYYETIKEKHQIVIGAVYEFKSGLGGTLKNTTTGADTLNTSAAELFQLPNVYGGGFSYCYNEQLTVGVDATFMDFANTKYFGATDSLNNRLKICVGGEYVHNYRSHRYIERMLWRVGANYSDSYIKLGNEKSKDFSITCGVGFPLRTTKTILNVNFEYGTIGIQPHSLLKENYFKIGINVALNEYWFIKQKIK